MKTLIKSMLLLTLTAAILPGCKKYLEDATENPNDPSVGSPGSLLANIEVATFSNYAGNSARRAAILTQQMAGTDGQMIQLANYQILEGDVTNEWKGIYNNAVINCNLLVESYGDKNPYYAGIAKILKALNIGLATDMWGDVPFTDAGLGLTGNTEPKYDTQESIYAGLQTLLTEAISDLSKDPTSNSYFPTGDLIFSGDAASWISSAWLLKARYANRLSLRDPSGSASLALDYLNNAGLTGTENDLNSIFGEGGTELNQWYAFESARGGYIRMGKYFVDTLTATADPRLPFYAALDDNGGYTGSSVDPSEADVTTSAIGPYFGSAASVAPIATYVEAKFIEAEAKFRAGDNDGAATAHNDAVKASILQITGTNDDTYEAAFAAEFAGTISLEKIMFQKYIALFTQVEVWNDWRRTNIPQLTPNPSGVVPGIPSILPTSQDERLYNPKATVITNLLSKVWWDNN